MKRFTCVLTLLVLAVLVLPATAQAAEISFFRGKTASVEFYATDPTGCFVTSITVFASDNRYFSPPAPLETEAWADVTIHLFNSCTWEQMTCGAGSFALPAGAFNVASLLTSATLNATGEIHDSCTGTDRPITVAELQALAARVAELMPAVADTVAAPGRGRPFLQTPGPPPSRRCCRT